MSKTRLRTTFHSLSYYNYRMWFVGQMVSLFGSWMQMTAQGYLVFQLTHSPVYLGYVSFAAGIPAWLFTLYGGVVADRVPRRTLLLVTQASMMALAFILAALTFSGLVQPWHIVLLAFSLGVTNAFDAPARQAFVPELVERKDLTNAIALNAAMFNSATAVGPAVAGLTYALFGPAWCFTINGLTYIAVIVALLLIKLPLETAPARRNSSLSDLKEGLDYVARQPLIRTLIGLIAMTSLFGFSFITLIPAWAVTVLGGNEITNGLLQSARGAGALTSALFIASLGHFKFKGRLLTVGTLAFPITLLIFAQVRWLPLSLLILVSVGAALILMLNLANAMVQTLVPDHLRGRVMGIYTMTLFGFMPIGGLLAGAAAEYVGEPITLTAGALVTLLVALAVWAFAPKLRTLE